MFAYGVGGQPSPQACTQMQPLISLCCCCFCFFFVFLACSAVQVSSSSCPIDFSYVDSFLWAPRTCQQQLASDNTCCVALLSTLGIGLSQYLRDTGFFELPDLATALSCLASYQSRLQLNGLTFNATGANDFIACLDLLRTTVS